MTLQQRVGLTETRHSYHCDGIQARLESLKGKTCCRQVKFHSGVYALAIVMLLPFKDSSEAAEPRCATPSAIKPPDTPRRSEARPR